MKLLLGLTNLMESKLDLDQNDKLKFMLFFFNFKRLNY